METARQSARYGHLAVHYRKPEEGPLAARLLRELGFTECYSMPQPDGNTFYHFVIDEQANRGTDRILYLLCMPEILRSAYDAIGQCLGIGTEAENQAVKAVREAQAHDPEFGFHAAIVVPTLEELEQMVERVARLAADDAELRGRVTLTRNRARPGTPEVDARMDASAIFRDVTRYTYGPNGVQVFVETDLLAGGPFGDNWVFEFDYVFPGYKDNILNAPSEDAQRILDVQEAAADA